MATSENAPELDTEARWGFAAPAAPLLEAEHRFDFLENAAPGTVVELHEELYTRTSSGNWLHLEELVGSSGSYSEYQSWNSSTPAQLAVFAGDNAQIRVLRFGEATAFQWS